MDLDFEYNYLIQVGINGPNVNLSFKKKLRSFIETTGQVFLMLVLVHYTQDNVHPAFRKGIKKLGIDINKIFRKIYFFFAYSSACKGDCSSVEESTEVAAKYAMQHTET